MNSRTLKLLTATTAFVAVASAGNAAITTYTSNSTIPVTTSNTTGINLSGTATISVSTTNAAIEVSGTVGSAAPQTISISSTAAVRNQAAPATITVMPDNNVTGLTINNSGTIANLSSNGYAVSATGLTGNATINNSGTISGSMALGNGTNTFTSTGTTSGAFTGGTTADNFSYTGATHTGAVDLGNGANGLTISNSSITGNIAGGTGADTFNISNSTITGNIELSSSTDILRLDNSRVNGNISSSVANVGGNTTLTLTNAIVSGTITDGTNNDSDVLTINGQNTFTTMGDISGYEAIHLDTDTVINNAISGASTVNIAEGKTVDVNASFQASAALTNSGTLNIAADETVTAVSYAGSGGTLGISVSDSTTAGKIGFTSTGAYATSMTVNLGANAGFITSGTRINNIISGTTTSTTLLNATTGVYRFSTVTSGASTSLIIGRVETSAVVDGTDNKAAAAALDTNTANTNTELKAVHSLIGEQSTAAGVANIVESLTPSIDGAGLASVNVTVDTGNQISNRLASVRSTSGVATGDALASQHMWVQGFGSTVKQDNKGGNAGYDASAGGMSLGVDTDTMVDGFTTGLAFSYGRGKVDSNASSNASTDIDSYIATVYGSRVLDSGVFLNGQIAGGYNKYDMTRNVIGVGESKGDTDAFQGSMKVEAGKDFAAGGFTLTPLASLQYTYLNMDKYTETGAGGASLTVDPEALSTVDAGAGGQVAYAIPMADGSTLKPSAHAKYIYRMGDTEMGTTSSFTGGTGTFNTSGVKADRSSVNLGAGLLLTTVAGTDLSVNYDADIRSNLTGHTGQLKARWAF